MNAPLLEGVRLHAPILAPAIMLAAAPVAAIIPSGRLAWAFACLAAFASATVAVALALSVWSGGPTEYSLGGWAAPLGVTLRADGLGCYALLLLGIAGAVGLFAGGGSLFAELEPRVQPLAAGLMLLALASALGVAIAGDFVALYVFLEIGGLAGYALVALGAGRDRRALPAAFRWLIQGGLAGGLILFGIGLLYVSTGVLDIALSASILSASETSRIAAAGLGLIVVGLAVKAALAPGAFGVCEALSRGAHFAALPLVVVTTGAALYALARMAALIGAAASPPLALGFGAALTVLATISVLIGSLQAIVATDLRRLAVYAGVAQAGCAALGAATGASAGLVAALFGLFNGALVVLALFAAAAALRRDDGNGVPLKALDGLGRRAPLLGGAVAVAALSLIGAPLTAGFLSKWLLLEALLQRGWWWAAAAALAASLSAVFFAGRLLARMYFRPEEAGAAPPFGRLWSVAPALALAACACVAFGIDAAWPLAAARAAGRGVEWAPPP